MTPLVPLLLAAAAYGLGVARLVQRGDRWPAARTGAAASGLVALGVALLPPLATRDEQFTVHVAQHLLLAMLAPLLLALSAPVTLALRALPRHPRRRLLRAVRSRAVGLLTAGPLVAVLAAGSPWLLYRTPLYAWTDEHAWLHLAVHAHMLLTGCLLSWWLVGTDPLPHRSPVRVRLAALVLVAAAHDVLARLVYADGLPGVAGDVRTGARLLYAGGDAVEVLLAVALLAQWYARTGRELARERGRTAPAQAGPGGRAFCG